MAIAFDAASDGGAALPGTSLSWSHTCTGSDRLLRVGTRGSSGGSDVITGVTYNGVALTKIGSSYKGSGDRWIAIWELANPASGSNTIVISSASDVILGLAVSYTGADVYDASATASTAGDFSLTVSATPTADNCWVSAFFGKNTGDTPSGGTGTTKRISNDGYGVGFFDNNAAISPAASTSLIQTTPIVASVNAIIASITPKVAAGGQPTAKRWGGVEFGASRFHQGQGVKGW